MMSKNSGLRYKAPPRPCSSLEVEDEQLRAQNVSRRARGHIGRTIGSHVISVRLVESHTQLGCPKCGRYGDHSTDGGEFGSATEHSRTRYVRANRAAAENMNAAKSRARRREVLLTLDEYCSEEESF